MADAVPSVARMTASAAILGMGHVRFAQGVGRSFICFALWCVNVSKKPAGEAVAFTSGDRYDLLAIQSSLTSGLDGRTNDFTFGK
jgi:hypothetical protein